MKTDQVSDLLKASRAVLSTYALEREIGGRWVGRGPGSHFVEAMADLRLAVRDASAESLEEKEARQDRSMGGTPDAE